MSEALISCPGCQSGMRVLKLDEATIDYCTFCGGAWFDPGEVAAVVGNPLQTTPSGRETRRKCARCKTPMAAASLGVVAVEQCPECRGIYLDQGEIDAVAERQLGLGARAAQSTRALTSSCAGCRSTFRLNELMVTAKGLACRHCFFALDYGSGTILSPSSHSSGGFGGSGGLQADPLVGVASGLLGILNG